MLIYILDWHEVDGVADIVLAAAAHVDVAMGLKLLQQELVRQCQIQAASDKLGLYRKSVCRSLRIQQKLENQKKTAKGIVTAIDKTATKDLGLVRHEVIRSLRIAKKKL